MKVLHLAPCVTGKPVSPYRSVTRSCWPSGWKTAEAELCAAMGCQARTWLECNFAYVRMENEILDAYDFVLRKS